jgi:hypothetical protein
MNQPSYLDLMKPEEISIKLCWGIFSEAIFKGVNPGPEQYEQSRRCFYAGFVECFKIMSDLSSTLTEEQAMKTLDRISAEASEFFELMRRTMNERGSA